MNEPPRAPMTAASPNEAHALMTDAGYHYLDVRSEAEFALGHPAAAFNVPLDAETARGTLEDCEFVRVVRAAFARDAKLIVGCASGKSSRNAARMLGAVGYQVIEQRAGFDGRADAFGRVIEVGWRELGLPVSEQPLPERTFAALRSRGAY